MNDPTPHGALSVARFVQTHGISRSQTYREIAEGRLRVMKVGRRTLISTEAAAEWRRLMEGSASPNPVAA